MPAPSFHHTRSQSAGTNSSSTHTHHTRHTHLHSEAVLTLASKATLGSGDVDGRGGLGRRFGTCLRPFVRSFARQDNLESIPPRRAVRRAGHEGRCNETETWRSKTDDENASLIPPIPRSCQNPPPPPQSHQLSCHHRTEKVSDAVTL
jgi:hypothetical protein